MVAEKKTQSEQRAAMLDAALSQIDKQFGKGSAMRLGDQERVKMKAIPTSSLALDIALGIGGLPKGRIIEIYGPESSGKCATADTLVPTNWGLLTIEEIFEQCGQKANCDSKITDVAHLGLQVANEFGKMESVVALTHNNKKPVLKIRTSAGREIKITHNHPVRIMNERGTIVWKEAGDLSLGQIMLGVTGGFENAKDRITEDEAVVAGYLIGDGSIISRSQTQFIQVDRQTMQEFKDIVLRIFPDIEFVQYDASPYRTNINNTRFRTYLRETLGLEHCKSPQKEIPWTVRSSSLTIQKAFLSALYECDGGVEKGTVCLSTSSEKLAIQVQAMLSTFELSATRLPKKVAAYPDNTYWTVSLPREDSVKFVDLIGFRSQRRAEQCKAITAVKTREAQTRNIPHQVNVVRDLGEALGGNREFYKIVDDLFRTLDNGKPFVSLSPQRTQKIIRWAEDNGGANHPLTEHLRSLLERNSSYETIVSITDGGEQPTFDLVVPGTQSFVANGLAVHNTTLALHAIANVQKEGGNVAFIDAEHALDPEYAEALGCNIDELIVSQPDTGEQALDITDLLIRSGAIDLIVVDSVAALVPRAEIEGDMGQSHVGLQARLMSQALRKITGGLNTTGTTAIFINQLREKIGVMFGCFQYSTRVMLADGTTEKIGKIVNQKMDVEVLSYNPDTNLVEPKQIINWFDNGKAEEFLQFTVEKSSGNGRTQFAATGNHDISTPYGWESAENLKINDKILVHTENRLSSQQLDIIKGSLMGDAALSIPKNSTSAKFRMGHGIKQKDYLEWKISLLSNIPHTCYSNKKETAVFVDFMSLEELYSLRTKIYINGKKEFSKEYFEELSPLAWAIWYMDDGGFVNRSKSLQKRTENGSGRVSFCVEAMTPNTQKNLLEVLSEKFNIIGKLVQVGKGQKATVIFDRNNTDKFLNLVYQHVHPSMDYKLLPGLRNHFVDKEVIQIAPYSTVREAKIINITVKPKTRSMNKFDIEVEGNHNYFVDGAMVHNSPETTTGGKALKFYASVRLDIRRIETLKLDGAAVANRTRVKVVKNKVSPPFKQAEFDIIFGEGISREGGIIDLGVEHGFIRKAGAWYTYEGDQLGQGKEKVRQFLKDNPALADEIENLILEKVGIRETDEVEEIVVVEEE